MHRALRAYEIVPPTLAAKRSVSPTGITISCRRQGSQLIGLQMTRACGTESLVSDEVDEVSSTGILFCLSSSLTRSWLHFKSSR